MQERGRFAFTAAGAAAASGRGKQAGGAGMRCVGGRIDGGGEGGAGERHLGDACDARGHAAQRRRVGGE